MKKISHFIFPPPPEIFAQFSEYSKNFPVLLSGRLFVGIC